MATPPRSDELLLLTIKAYEENNYNAEEAARNLSISSSTFKYRLKEAQQRFPFKKQPPKSLAARLLPLSIQTGTVLVGGDGHYWPGIPVPAHDAFVERAKHLRDSANLYAIIYIGDAFDGARISKWPRIGWEQKPTVREELDECKRRMEQLLSVAKSKEETGIDLIWCLGNHDFRFETNLAKVAHEYEEIEGFHLKDHFPHWRPCWGCRINNTVVLKHRFKGGIHARRNNIINSGCSIVTGHLHRLGVTPVSDYSGTKWGVETGLLGNVDGPMFSDYTEDGPLDWQMGWVELNFKDGRLQWPEVHFVEREVYGVTATENSNPHS